MSPVTPVANGRGSPRKQQRFSVSAVNSAGLSNLSGVASAVSAAAASCAALEQQQQQQQRSAYSRKCSMPAVTGDLRNLVYTNKSSKVSTASLPGIMGMITATAVAGANQSSQSGGTNFSELFAQQILNKQLDVDLVAGTWPQFANRLVDAQNVLREHSPRWK